MRLEIGDDIVESGFNGREVESGIVNSGDCLVERSGREEKGLERLEGGVELSWIRR